MNLFHLRTMPRSFVLLSGAAFLGLAAHGQSISTRNQGGLFKRPPGAFFCRLTLPPPTMMPEASAMRAGKTNPPSVLAQKTSGLPHTMPGAQAARTPTEADPPAAPPAVWVVGVAKVTPANVRHSTLELRLGIENRGGATWQSKTIVQVQPALGFPDVVFNAPAGSAGAQLPVVEETDWVYPSPPIKSMFSRFRPLPNLVVSVKDEHGFHMGSCPIEEWEGAHLHGHSRATVGSAVKPRVVMTPIPGEASAASAPVAASAAAQSRPTPDWSKLKSPQ